MQLRLTPLEEVFLNVTRKAELEHAEVCRSGCNLTPRKRDNLTHVFHLQAEGRYELLTLTEEGLAIKVPVGAEFISSPG